MEHDAAIGRETGTENRKPMKRLVVIVGPTAIGKTAAAITLAQQLQTEILSCDSRQFYRELEIGVARPSPTELQTVPHHFIANRSVQLRSHRHCRAVARSGWR